MKSVGYCKVAAGFCRSERMSLTARLMIVVVTLGSCLALSGCDGRTCDQEKRSTCTAKVSRCINDKCAGKEGEDYNDCFKYLCLSDFCQCLDDVGCAWQETSCDDVI